MISEEIKDSKATRIVLDLRNNPGGYLDTAVDVAGWFVESGEVVVIQDFPQEHEQETLKASGSALFSTYPTVVLMNILGISAFYHDSAAALIDQGQILAAAQEERFTRIKQDSRFPVEAVRFCLMQSGFTIAELDAVVFYDKPLLKFERQVLAAGAHDAPLREHVHIVWHYVVQQALVVRHDDDCILRRLELVDAIGDNLQRIDV